MTTVNYQADCRRLASITDAKTFEAELVAAATAHGVAW